MFLLLMCYMLVAMHEDFAFDQAVLFIDVIYYSNNILSSE